MTPGEMILVARQKCIKFYKTYERIINPMMRFLMVLIALIGINSTVGYMVLLNKPLIVMGISIGAMFLSPLWIMIMLMLIVSGHMLAFDVMIGLATLVVCIVLYITYVRLYPKESLLIVVTVLAIKFNIAYMVPIIAGLFGGLACIIAITLGVVFSFTLPLLNRIIESSIGAPIDNLIKTVISMMNQHIFTNTTMLAMIGIFVVVFITVYFVRKQSLDYAPYLAIALGGVMNILGFGMAILFLKIEMNVFLLIIMTILSVMIAVLCEFFSKVLDYSRAEVLQFEDEDNYYYVKVVPKVSISTNKRRIQQVYTTTTKENSIHIDL